MTRSTKTAYSILVYKVIVTLKNENGREYRVERDFQNSTAADDFHYQAHKMIGMTGETGTTIVDVERQSKGTLIFKDVDNAVQGIKNMAGIK